MDISNSNDNTIVVGTSGADSIFNYGGYTSISGEGGDDTLKNNGGGSSISGGMGNDYIANVDGHWLNGNAGNDTIDNYSNGVQIYGGTGNDLISNRWGEWVRIYGEDGDDTLTTNSDGVVSSNATINGGKGNDQIEIEHDDSKGFIEYGVGDGNDTIIGFRSNSTLKITDGSISSHYQSGDNYIVKVGNGSITFKDVRTVNIHVLDANESLSIINYDLFINNDENNKIINGSSNADWITNSARSVTINGNDGNDVLQNNGGRSVSIDGNDGDDFISNNEGEYAIINGGNGDDTVYNDGEHVLIKSGAGNDSIYNDSNNRSVGKNSLIDAGADDDYVYNRSDNITLNGNSGDDSVENIGSYVFINCDDGNDTIYNYGSYNDWGDHNSILGGTGDDLIYNTASTLSIDGGADNDTINSSGAYVTLGGGLGDDSIYNTGERTSIGGGAGNDTIWNFNKYVSIDGGADNDLISNESESVLILGGAGNDSIVNTGENVDIKGDAGNDSINNSGDYISIDGDADDDFIFNVGERVSINGGADSDIIDNSGWYNTIYGGDGNDSIHNTGGNVTVTGGKGDDSIQLDRGWNGATNVIQYASDDGNDIIVGYQSNDNVKLSDGSHYSTLRTDNDVIISVGSGSMTLKDATDAALNIIGGEYIEASPEEDDTTVEDDTTTVEDDTTTVEDDTTTVEEDTTTVEDDTSTVEDDTTTVEDDTTTVEEDTTTVEDDTTTIEDDTTTTPPTIEHKTISNSNSNTQIAGTFGNDTISNNGGSNVTIRAGLGDDFIYNNVGTNIAINSGDGNDSVYNDFAEYISISGDAGDDSIFGTDNYATLDGGAGNDTLTGNHFRSIVNGGDGDDYISLGSYWYNTIEGGKGNDIIRFNGSNNLIKYAAGDGNDTVYGFGANDTLTITGGSYSRSTVDNDVYVSLNGGTIILNGAKGKSININNENLSVDTVDAVDTNTPQDVIKRFMKSLDDSTEPVMIDMLNNAIKDASGGKYSNIQDVIDQMIADCQKYNAADDKNGWRRFLLEKCDINLDNADTGAISGYDAGGSDEEKTLENIISEDTNLNSSFTDAYFNIGNLNFGGLNVYLAKQTPSNTVERINYTDSSLKTEERKTWQGMQSGWLQNAFNLIGKSFGSNFGFGAKSTSTLQENSLYVTFKNAKSGEVASVSPGSINNKGETKGPLNLNVNIHHFPAFRNGTVSDAYINASDDYIGNSYYFERILAHELTHVVMDANIINATGDNGLPQFIKEGMAELTHGCDDNRQDEISMYAGSPDSLKEALDLKTSGNYGAYAGGYIFLRYIAKQFSSKGESDSYDVAIQSPSDGYIEPPEGMMIIGSSLLSVSSAFADDRIAFSDYGADINKANATALKNDVAILGGTLNDSINSGSKNDKMYGGDGNDTLIGNAGNDTLTGGSGSDLFVYESGDDVIADYAAGVDKIQLRNCSIANSTLEGDDVIINTDGGALIVKDGREQLITVIDRDGVETTQIYGKNILTADNVAEFDGVTLKSSKLTLDAPFTGSVNLADFSSKVKKVDATKTTSAVEIIGNDKGNTFKAGSGGSTLDGGGKNDKLYGGDGYDVFIFDGQGKDKVYNYEAGDRIILTADVTKSKLSGKNLKITVEGGGVLTVNKILETEMTITTSDGETNNYIFDKQHKTLEDALNNTAAQFPSDYWFLNDNQRDDELSSIVSTDNAVDFDYDQTVEAIKPSMNDLITSARHRQKK